MSRSGRTDRRLRVGALIPAGDPPRGRYLDAAVGTLTILLAGKSGESAVDDSSDPAAARADREDADTVALLTQAEPDDDVVRKLHGRYFDRVYSYLRLTLRDAGAAEDATEEVFVEVLRGLPESEDDLRFRSWLFRVARRAAIERMRENRGLIVNRPRSSAATSPQGESERFGVGFPNDDEFMAMLEVLPRAEQQVILLRYLFELRYGEIADLLGRSVGAVRELHHEALRSLRRGFGARNQNSNGQGD